MLQHWQECDLSNPSWPKDQKPRPPAARKTPWRRLWLGTWLSLLIIAGGCGGGLRGGVALPPRPQPKPRQAQALCHPDTGQWGVWESVASEANGVEYLLELEKYADQMEVIVKHQR